MTANTEIAETRRMVSVIVVTFNGSELLRNCLLSLRRQDYPNIEIIVVDNGSEENIRDLLQREFPEALCVRVEKNSGFAGGSNRGIERARGEYVALINNDAAAEAQWISALVKVAESDGSLGAVGSIIVDGNNPSVLDSCGVGIALDGMSRQAMNGQSIPLLSAPLDVLAISGCACLFRREAIQETGLFDERFFAYCEDTDLCLRLRRAGWNIVVAPGARVTHYYSRTAGPFSLKKIFWLERNHFWVAAKNFPLFMLPIVPFVSLWRCVVLLYAALCRVGPSRTVVSNQGAIGLALTIIAAQAVAIIGLPLMIARRLRPRPAKRRGDLEISRQLFKHRISVYEIIAGGNRPRRQPILSTTQTACQEGEP